MSYIKHFLFSIFLLSGNFTQAQTSLPERFNKLLLPYFKNNEPGGVVMVAKNGQIIYKKAFGMANMELDVPVNDSMIFYIGSNTKQFTAVAILQLVEKGKIQLQDTLGKFIPSCPYPVSGVSIQQMLSHTSGIGSKNEADVKKLLIDKKGDKQILMDFGPGTKWEYNNMNYSLLGYIIEKLTGKTYPDYITENIFEPAGMFNTYVDKELSIVKNRPSSYTNFKTGVQNSKIPGKIGAAGGIQSTVGDMLKWNHVLKSDKLLKPETLKLALTRQLLSDGKPTTYGFGWHLEELHGSPTIRHGGLVPGFTSETLYLPQEDVYVVILLNSETSKIPIVALSRILAGLTIDKPYSFDEVALNKDSLKKFMGVYETESGELLNIAQQNELLTFQRPNGAVYPLHYAGNREFFFDRDFLRVEFTANAAGKMGNLKFSKVDIGASIWYNTERPLLKLSPEKLADSLLKQYAGKYYLAGSDTLTIKQDGPNLYYQADNQPNQLLAAENSTLFFSLKGDLHLEFKKDPVTNALGLFVIQDKKSKKYLKL